MRQNFNVVNENLVFREGNVLFSFEIPKDSSRYLLYYVKNFEDNSYKLLVSELIEDERDYCYLIDIDKEKKEKVKKYISSLLEGRGFKKEIKISNEMIKFEEDRCLEIIESGNGIECSDIENVLYAIGELPSQCFNEFIYIRELNDMMYDKIVSRDKERLEIYKKENIKGNINIFLLTLFAVSFLIILIFMGYGLFFVN